VQAEVPEDVRADVVLAVHEAVVNAIEHARRCTTVSIDAEIENGTVVADVRDDGSWKQPTFGGDERGRGILLIRGLLSHVSIDAGPSGTTARMVRHVDGALHAQKVARGRGLMHRWRREHAS
jgi:anti-sigma regulatory factor (Ser/Thr protein kinase)